MASPVCTLTLRAKPLVLFTRWFGAGAVLCWVEGQFWKTLNLTLVGYWNG